MDKNQAEAEKRRAYREEAAQLLEILQKPSTAKENPNQPR